MDMSLFFLGTAGSVPSARRGLPAILIRHGSDRLLFDCGEGTQRQLLRSVGLPDLDTVFITHFHADHWLGLPGMLKSFALRERSEPLSVYGPKGLSELMSVMRIVYGRLPYELTITELEPAETVAYDGYMIAAIPVRHKAQSPFGYAFVEEPRPGHLDAALAERLGVTPGPDFGRLQRGETVAGVKPEQVMGESREGRKVVISGDTAPCEALALAAHQADVLVHEATFAEDEAERAQLTQHARPRSSRVTPRCVCWRSPTSQAATPAVSCVSRPVRSSPRPRRRVTSTRSRCPSPSAEGPRSSAGLTVRRANAHKPRPPRPRPSPSHRPDTFQRLL